MKKTMAAVACLFACSVVVAAPSTWEYRYEGLVHVGEVLFPLTSLAGKFSGEDLDGNGTLSTDELTYLSWQGIQALPTISWPAADPGPPPSDLSYSSVDRFSFTAPNMLSFAGLTGAGYRDEWTVDTGNEVVWSNPAFRQVWQWGPNTTLTVTPVPEPSAWALMVAGLWGTVAYATKRRRRQSGRVSNAGSRRGLVA
jgi:hypothetical protein